MIGSTHPYLLALAGGGLIGLASGGFFLLSGKIAGVSGVLGNALALERGAWRWAFLLGLVAAGALSARFFPAPEALTQASPSALAVSGLIVGVGAYVGSGCTSGHGVCGLSRFSLRSLVAVLVFMAAAIVTVFLGRVLTP